MSEVYQTPKPKCLWQSRLEKQAIVNQEHQKDCYVTTLIESLFVYREMKDHKQDILETWLSLANYAQLEIVANEIK